MSQTLTAPVHNAPMTAASVVVLQGRDPATGHLATWHLLPLGAEDDAETAWRVERVAGPITHPAVWMQAAKEVTVVTAAEARLLQAQLRSI